MSEIPLLPYLYYPVLPIKWTPVFSKHVKKSDACKCKCKKNLPEYSVIFPDSVNALRRSSSVLESVLVELLPPHAQANQRRNARAGDAHGKHDLDARHIAVNDKWLLVEGESVADLGGARQDEHGLADLRSVLEDVADHGVDKG